MNQYSLTSDQQDLFILQIIKCISTYRYINTRYFVFIFYFSNCLFLLPNIYVLSIYLDKFTIRCDILQIYKMNGEVTEDLSINAGGGVSASTHHSQLYNWKASYLLSRIYVDVNLWPMFRIFCRTKIFRIQY